jgi:hypothetical protein
MSWLRASDHVVNKGGRSPSSASPGLVPGGHGATLQSAHGFQITREIAAAIGRGKAQGLTAMWRLKCRAMDARNTSGQGGMEKTGRP